jgi:adenylate cyclase
MERKLAAILAADVVGYSRLMAENEADTFDRLRAHRQEVFEPEISKHHGRIFKLMGDGLLAEFGSVVDAVECAAALQREMARRNEGLTTRIDMRIGVHVGDVIVEDDDRHGDAVNLATRFQQLAEPGGICVSRAVMEQVKQKVALGFELRGEEHLKNMAEPVRVYRVAGTPQVSVTRATVSTEKPSVAVLPFQNMSGDPEQEYFSDGITEDVITELARFRELLVIGRTSSFAFRDKAMDMREMGRTLGAGYLVEGQSGVPVIGCA